LLHTQAAFTPEKQLLLPNGQDPKRDEKSFLFHKTESLIDQIIA